MVFFKRHSWIVTILSVLYPLVSYFLIGFKAEQLFLVALVNFLFYVSGVTKRVIIGFSIFIIYWILFDYMKAIPNYLYHSVDILPIYNLDKKLFGINYQDHLLSLNEYLHLKQNSFLDVMAGIFYLTWVPVPMLFALYLFFTKREQFFYFSLTFLLVNIMGFVIYYLHPAAPPWYIQQYGTVFNPLTLGNTAGLGRFDMYFGVEIFKSIYAKSSNVFAAMPSLHSSYPLLVLYYGIKNRLRYINILFAIIMIGIWFSAVYTSHHYFLDVFSGIACALSGIMIFHYLLKTQIMKNLIRLLMKATQ